jgi:hypothetical protein
MSREAENKVFFIALMAIVVVSALITQASVAIAGVAV